MHSEDSFAPVVFLSPKAWHTEDKPGPVHPILLEQNTLREADTVAPATRCVAALAAPTAAPAPTASAVPAAQTPAGGMHGWLHYCPPAVAVCGNGDVETQTVTALDGLNGETGTPALTSHCTVFPFILLSVPLRCPPHLRQPSFASVASLCQLTSRPSQCGLAPTASTGRTLCL